MGRGEGKTFEIIEKMWLNPLANLEVIIVKKEEEKAVL